MPILFRKSFKVGPLRFNFGRSGFTSWGVKVGAWSWNSKTRSHRVDLPGPMSWTSRRPRRSTATRTANRSTRR